MCPRLVDKNLLGLSPILVDRRVTSPTFKVIERQERANIFVGAVVVRVVVPRIKFSDLEGIPHKPPPPLRLEDRLRDSLEVPPSCGLGLELFKLGFSFLFVSC